MSFVPALTTSGKPCKLCSTAGELCAVHNGNAPTLQPISGLWRSAYLSALRKGYTKSSSAGAAGVTKQTVLRHQREDADFADEVEIAYTLGTQSLEDLAWTRMLDENKPADGILKHMLSYRGITSTSKVEVTGKGGAALETASTIPFHLLSPDLKVKIIEELEAIERGEPLQIGPVDILEGVGVGVTSDPGDTSIWSDSEEE